MLEQLLILGFQGHDRLEIDLDPLVTVFRGPTDSGKSSILRALRWLCLNRPDGDAHVHRGKSRALVRLNLEGHKIVRERGKVNAYRLDGREFVSFGREVPEPVTQVLNVGDVNFQDQHDAPFWFSLTPGQVSRELNAIVDLDLVDFVLAELASRVRQATGDVEQAESRLNEARKEVDSLVWVEEADRRLREVEELQSALAENLQKRAVIDDLLKEGERVDRELERLERALPLLQKAVQAAERGMELQKQIDHIQELLKEGEEWARKERQASEELEEIRQEIQERTKGICPLCGKSPFIPCP